MKNYQHETILTNGINLHYVTQGKGPLMLMLHGFPEFWYSWRHQIEEFSKDYKVVALDLRGYNLSDKPKEKSAYRMDEFIKDVEGVIKGLDFDKCTLVSHDWGAMIAWNFAYEKPEMIDRLVILNVPHPAKMAKGLRTFKQLKKSWYMFFFQIPRLPEWLLGRKHCQMIGQMFKPALDGSESFTKHDIKEFRKAAARPGVLNAALNYYRNAFSPEVLKKKWGVLEVPTLMVWGEDDLALGKELTYGTEKYVRDFRIHYIPNCNHWVQQQRPELVNRYMREFLSPV